MYTHEQLVSIQEAREAGAKASGIAAFMRSVEKDKARGTLGNSQSSYRFASGLIPPLSESLSEWIEKAGKKAGSRHSLLPLLVVLPTDSIAYIAIKTALNGLSKAKSEASIARQIGSLINHEYNAELIRKGNKSAYNVMIRQSQSKLETHRKVSTANWIAGKHGIQMVQWTIPQQVGVGTILLMMLVEMGVIEREVIREGKSQRVLMSLSDDTLDWLKNANEQLAELNPIYEPMVVPPQEWVNPMSGGYITNHLPPIGLTKMKSKKYKALLKAHDLSQVYAAMNKIQATKFQINEDMLDLMEHLVTTDSEIGGLPRSNPSEYPQKPEDIETNTFARRQYAAEYQRVHKENIALKGRRMAVLQNLRCARGLAEFEAIYIPVQLDWRGRVYCVPSLNYQGEDYVKSLLRFSEGKPLGARGARWLAIHLANLMGVDKVDFDSRELWTHLHSSEILSYAEDPLNNRGWLDADKPFQFLAACFEWEGYCEEGEKFKSHLAIALDGSCSGLQNFGMALHCEETGKAVNLVPSDRPQDIYKAVSDKVYVNLLADLQIAPETSLEGIKAYCNDAMLSFWEDTGASGYDPAMSFEDYKSAALNPKYDANAKLVKRSPWVSAGRQAYMKPWLAWCWLQLGVSRKTAKRAVMTYPYGAKRFGFVEQLQEDILRPAKDEGNYHFGDDGFDAATYMAGYLWDAIQKVVLKAAEAMNWLQEVARIVAATGKPIVWRNPAGLPVMQCYFKTSMVRVFTTYSGKINLRWETKLHEDTNTLDIQRNANGISPNFVHSLDASHLMRTVTDTPLDSFMLIHDSFGTHAAETDTLFAGIREAFFNQYTETDVLEKFRMEMQTYVDEELPHPPSKGNLDLSLIKKSQYAFA